MNVPSTLTVKQIEEIAENFNIKLKSKLKKEKLAEINAYHLPDDKLLPLIQNIKNRKKTTNKISRKSSISSKNVSKQITETFSINKSPKSSKTIKITSKDFQLLINRVTELENQVKFLYSKIRNFSKPASNNSQYVNTATLKKKIHQILNQYNQISTDDLFEHPKLNSYNSNTIEEALLELSAESVIDLGEGPSKHKVNRDFGLIVLR